METDAAGQQVSCDFAGSALDGRTNTVTATVSVGAGPFGVTADPKTNTIYIANAIDNTVSVLGS